jgi:O-antigen ligase
MMANCLGLAIMLVILSERLGWMKRNIAWVVGGAMLVTALFALTPGFGGLLLMLGVWLWHRRPGKPLGRSALTGGLVAGALEIPVAAVTPILHRTAPYLIHIPGLPTLAPGIRLLVWTDAVRNFLAHPIVGRGIGVDPVRVPYVSPEGASGDVTDAHNMVLSVAVQSGVLGVAAMLTIILFAARRMARGGEVVFGLALAFLSGIIVQGLVGSFEDARHLWFAYGLMLAAGKRSVSAEINPNTSRERAPH